MKSMQSEGYVQNKHMDTLGHDHSPKPCIFALFSGMSKRADGSSATVTKHLRDGYLYKVIEGIQPISSKLTHGLSAIHIGIGNIGTFFNIDYRQTFPVPILPIF